MGLFNGERANDPFGTKDDRNLTNSVQGGLETANQTLARIGNQLFTPGVSDTRTASENISSLVANNTLNDPITVEALTANPAFGAVKSAVESQFANARESAIATGGEGGALSAVLGGLEGGRASSLAGELGRLALTEDARRRGNFAAELEASRILGQLGLGQTGQAAAAVGGGAAALGALGSQQAAIARANIAGDTSNTNQMIETAGEMGGSKAGGK